ncbi:IS200/IS605 family transposase [uncultured Draconibacterium sp.]|uniref:IS200/IS605 family transposase n=1 Tax=uncultured Draconibacterium sp. TaxID=1573823 RepID=UPI00321646ED
MSYTRILIHCVWTTKDRKRTILPVIRKELIQHFIEYANAKEIHLLEVNVWENHCHALISLGRNQTIAEIMRMMKGESSHWLNNSGKLPFKFLWQDDYYAVSVSESHMKAVYRYIRGQEVHHKKMSWEEELNLFLAKYPNS